MTEVEIDEKRKSKNYNYTVGLFVSLLSNLNHFSNLPKVCKETLGKPLTCCSPLVLTFFLLDFLCISDSQRMKFLIIHRLKDSSMDGKEKCKEFICCVA